MKKQLLGIVTILVMVFSMLPSGAALAKDGGSSNVNVRNRTGGIVTLMLTNADRTQTITLVEGTYDVSIPVGAYSYYAVTPCGTQTGSFNLTNRKMLFFTCNTGPEAEQHKIVPPAPLCLLGGVLPHIHAIRRNTFGPPCGSV